MRVDTNNIIPITEAKSKLNSIVNNTSDNNFYVLSKQGKPSVAVINIDYLDTLMKQDALQKIRQFSKNAKRAFSQFLELKGINPKKLTDEEAKKLLFDEFLTDEK
jgi:prevent-host-death family protein